MSNKPIRRIGCRHCGFRGVPRYVKKDIVEGPRGKWYAHLCLCRRCDGLYRVYTPGPELNVEIPLPNRDKLQFTLG